MKDNSFENAMNKIVGQHEAEKQEEIRAEKRAVIFGRVRSIFVFLAIATVLVVAYNYREKLTDLIKGKPVATADTAEGQTSATLKTAQQNAATRDSVIDSIAK